MTTNHDPLRAGRAAFANAGLIQESKDSPPTTDELVEALRELRAAKGALIKAEQVEIAARNRARDLTKRARPDFDWLGSTENGLSVAIAERVLEERPAKPDDTPATFKPGDMVEIVDKARCRGVVLDGPAGSPKRIRVRWLCRCGASDGSPLRSDLRLIVAAPESSE